MPAHTTRLESRLLATAAMGLALAVTAPYREAEAADICGVGTTTITTAQANTDNCVLAAGESVDVQAPNGSILFTGADDAIIVTGTNAGSITNAGDVSSDLQAVEVRSGASLTGAITNSGTLTSNTTSGDGILLDDGSVDAGIDNSGTIDSARDGVRVFGTGGDVAGGITNSGTITANQHGVQILNSASVTSGGITNEGDITSSGNDGIGLVGGGTEVAGGITNAAGATIDGADDGISLVTSASVTSGGITNSGDIDAGSSGIKLDNAAAIDAGGISNASGADITAAAFGILIDNVAAVTGGISNAGDITSTGNDGLLIDQSSTIADGITNASGATIDGTDDGIEFNGTASVTSGGVTNAGTITAVDDGIGINGQASITGDVTNAAGGLIDSGEDGVFLTNGTITGDLVNAGTIDADRDGIFVDATSTITGSIENSGNITGGVNGIHIDDSGVDGITNAAGATITGGTFSIQIAGPDAPITVTNAGTLVGEVQLNDGTLVLNGSSSRVAGAVSGLASSTVNVNGDFTTEGTIDVGTLSIASSADLTLNNNVTVDSGFSNAGTVAIADGTTRTVTGDYTQTGNGTLEIGATSDSSFGKLVTTGTVDLSASDALHVTVGSGAGLATGDELVDVIAAGTLTASGVTITDSSALLVFEGVIDNATVDLKVSRSRSIETIAEDADGNGDGAAGALDDIIAEGASGDMQNVIDALNTLGTDEEIEDALEKLLPAITGSHAQGSVVVARAGANNVVQDRLIRLTGLNAGSSFVTDPVAWIKPFAADTAQSSRGGVSGFDGITIGAAAGVDGQFTEDVRAGAALSYADASIKGRGASNSRIDIDTVQLTGYGTYDIDRKTHLNILGAVGWNGNDSSREVDFGGLDRTAEADYDSWHITTEIELVRSYELTDDLGLMPSLSAAYSYARADSYSETGAGAANLDVDASDADSLDLGVSGRLIYGLHEGIDLSGNLGLAYDVLAGDDQVTATFQGGGGSFVTESIDPAPLGVTAGVALELVPESGIDVRLAYDIDVREDFSNQKVQLNIRFPF